MILHPLPDGWIIEGDSTDAEVVAWVAGTSPAMVIADPPYGNIIQTAWDRTKLSQSEFADWLLSWIGTYTEVLPDGGAMYVWGGFGRQRFRPFLEMISRVEAETDLQLANLITWSKRRAYGIQWGYLQTREELAYMVKGDHKKPRVFNVPYLDTLRGYDGYNPDYPAKSPYLRRTSVWTDITELLRGKIHPTEKPARLAEVMIAASSMEGDVILDPFAGSGSTGVAARKLGRRFILIEADPEYVVTMLDRLDDREAG